MVIYLVTFTAALILFSHACRGESRAQMFFYAFLSSLVLSIVAGIRNEFVGTDVLFYGSDLFYEACTNSSYMDFSPASIIRFEPGYLFLNHIVSRFTGNFNIFLFVVMFIQVFVFLMALLHYKDKYPVIWGLVVFLLLYYNTSLNLMRQMLSVSFAFYGFRFILERKRILFLLFVFLAFLMHRSAAIFLVAYPIYWLLEKRPSYKIVLGMIALAAGVFFLIQQAVETVLIFVGLPTKYAYYFSDATEGFFITRFLLSLPFLGLVLLNREPFFEKEKGLSYFLLMSLLLLVLSTQAREWLGNHAERFFVFFTFFQVIAVPKIIKIVDEKSSNAIYVKIATVGYMLFFWYYNYIYNGFEGTYPYSSDILNSIM